MHLYKLVKRAPVNGGVRGFVSYHLEGIHLQAIYPNFIILDARNETDHGRRLNEEP